MLIWLKNQVRYRTFQLRSPPASKSLSDGTELPEDHRARVQQRGKSRWRNTWLDVVDKPAWKEEADQFKFEEFEMLAKLGQGGFGKVTLAKYNQKFYAVKQVNKERLAAAGMLDTAIAERDIMRMVDSYVF